MIDDRCAVASDDRCANFSASTCPTQILELIASSTADKLPLEKFHRLLDLIFWEERQKISIQLRQALVSIFVTQSKNI